MNLYNFIFVWLTLFAILINYVDVTVRENVLGKDVRRWSVLAAVLVFLPIFLLACLGTPQGDTPLYIASFQKLSFTWSDLLSQMQAEESGRGFLVLEFIIKKLVGNNVTSYRVIIAAIHSVPLVLIFRKYSENYLMSIFLFVASACHVAWMMNGLRQFIAVVIIFASTPLLCKRRYLELITIIILAYTIHTSALVMLPVIFIVQGRAWNKKTILYIIVALIAMYIFNKYTGSFDALFVGTEYEGTVASLQEQGDDGTNPIRVLVNSVPMLLAFIGRKYVKYEDDIMLNICVNMSVITTGLYLISMVTSGIMVGRLPIYTGLYRMILLPNLIPKMFTKRSAKIINVFMIVFYCVYYIYEVVM